MPQAQQLFAKSVSLIWLEYKCSMFSICPICCPLLQCKLMKLIPIERPIPACLVPPHLYLETLTYAHFDDLACSLLSKIRFATFHWKGKQFFSRDNRKLSSNPRPARSNSIGGSEMHGLFLSDCRRFSCDNVDNVEKRAGVCYGRGFEEGRTGENKIQECWISFGEIITDDLAFGQYFHVRVILIQKIWFYQLLPCFKLFHFVPRFQNRFCFCSTTIPSAVRKVFLELNILHS